MLCCVSVCGAFENKAQASSVEEDRSVLDLFFFFYCTASYLSAAAISFLHLFITTIIYCVKAQLT